MVYDIDELIDQLQQIRRRIRPDNRGRRQVEVKLGSEVDIEGHLAVFEPDDNLNIEYVVLENNIARIVAYPY